jgi:hypothetical protein
MEELPVSQVLGLGGLFWAARQWWLQRRSKDWQLVSGAVEGREFLRFSSNGGWFVLFYKYMFNGKIFSGEWRKGIISRKTDTAATDPDTIELARRFPHGSAIRVRVDSHHPERSFAEL